MTPLRIETLTVDGLENPLGLNSRHPRFSWTLWGEGRDRRQTAYQIVVRTADEREGQPWWDSGRVESSQSTWVPYGGRPLQSRTRYAWTVRVWDEQGLASDESAPAWWETALLHDDDWQSHWIAADPEFGLAVDAPEASDLSEATRRLRPCLYLRREFTVAKPICRARWYATARGVYIPFLNGQRVGERVLDPGWTDYRRRILYQTFDVTEQVTVGANAMGLILGDGWYSGYVGFERQRRHYGERPLAFGQLELLYQDGSFEVIATDGAWQVRTGPIRYSDLLMGERYDARLERDLGAWTTPGGAGSGWSSASIYSMPRVQLDADATPGIRVTEERRPVSVRPLDSQRWVVDLGQNLVGWVRLRVRGAKGQTIRFRYAEMLNPDGSLYTDNLRAAEATDVYIVRGDGDEETFEPHFTYHGFRYVEVSGLADEPGGETVVGRVVHNALARTGTFLCSDPMVNQLQSNITWSQRGNFVSVPTDCPQRDERLGWLADAHIFARTATFNMDVAPFFHKWLTDVRDAQGPDGAFSNVAPRLVDTTNGAPAWGDAGVIIPWIMYLVYGDRRFLEDNYPAMARWIQYLREANPDGLWLKRRWRDFGDWLAVGERTPKDLVATAFYAYDAALMARIARVLGHEADAQSYQQLFDQIRAAFQRAFVRSDGSIAGETQTGYVLALHMNLVPEAMRPVLMRKLVDNIRAHDWHLTTGFIGVGYLCPVLSEGGESEVAYRLLLSTSFPSWGYAIEHGATSMWERWDGWTQEQGFQTPAMNSFNHYAFGSVGEWLYRYVAGMDADPDQPGFAHVRIHPQISPALARVSATYQSVRGQIATAWRREGADLVLEVTIPANSWATVVLPYRASSDQVTEGGQALLAGEGIRRWHGEENTLTVDIGSGHYQFRCAGIFNARI